MNDTMKEFADILYRELKELSEWIEQFGMDEPFLVMIRRRALMLCNWIQRNA